MKKLICILLIIVLTSSICAASAQSGYEELQSKLNAVIVEKYDDIGSIDAYVYGLSLNVQQATITDIQSNESSNAIRLETYDANSKSYATVGFIDASEIDNAIEALEYVSSNSGKMSKLTFVTSSGMTISYRATVSKYIFFLDPTGEYVHFEKEKIPDIIDLLKKAKDAMTE